MKAAGVMIDCIFEFATELPGRARDYKNATRHAAQLADAYVSRMISYFAECGVEVPASELPVYLGFRTTQIAALLNRNPCSTIATNGIERSFLFYEMNSQM